MSGKLYFTMGMQRCGKSTYCTKWASEAPNRVIVCADDIRLALHGKRYNKLSETMVFAIKHVMIRAHLNRGNDVIVDGTHSSKISIQRILEIEPNAIPIMFDTPIEECKRRALASGHDDLATENGPIERVGRRLDHIRLYGLEDYIEDVKNDIEERGLYKVV